jgi:hypothetical protein
LNCIELEIRIMCRRLFIILPFLLPCCLAEGELITNGSFETPESIGGLPTSFGDWGADAASIVGAENGITPFDGVRMLRLDSTTFNGTPGGTIGTVYQHISAAGSPSSIRATARVNRVAGDAQTDTEFLLQIEAYDGTIADLNSASPFPGFTGQIASSRTTIISDSNLDSWQEVSAEMTLPSQTTFYWVGISAIENVFNDTTGSEFDGHYADLISVTAIPEPSNYVMLTMIGVGMILIRRSRNNAMHDESPSRDY